VNFTRPKASVSAWGRQILLPFSQEEHFGPFIGLQVPEKRRGYGGSIESNSVVRDPLGEKQLLQALAVVERRLDPEVRDARQDAFRERQDAFYVEFLDRLRVVVDLRQRQFLAELVALAAVGVEVDRFRVGTPRRAGRV
jgi:hypothetical protein